MRLLYEDSELMLAALGGFILIGFISSAFALQPLTSYAKLLPFVLAAYGYYHIAKTDRWTNKNLMRLLNILIGCIFLMSFYGNLQYFIALSKGVAGLQLRVTSLTTHPNSLAKFILPFIPICITMTFLAKEKHRLLYGFIAINLVATEMFTISRGAWIGMAIGALLLILLFRSYWLVVGVAILGGIAVVVLPPEIGIERFNSIFSLSHQWNVERINVWNASISMIKDHPYFGLGLNNFQYYYLDYKPEWGVEIFAHAHNTFLNIAVELGLFAVALFIAFILSVYILVFKNISLNIKPRIISKSILIGIISLLSFGMVEYNFNNELQIVLFFILLGIAYRLMKNSLLDMSH